MENPKSTQSKILAALGKALALFVRVSLALLPLVPAAAFVYFAALPTLGLTATLIYCAIGAMLIAWDINVFRKHLPIGNALFWLTLPNLALIQLTFMFSWIWFPFSVFCHLALGCLAITACEWGLGISFEVVCPSPYRKQQLSEIRTKNAAYWNRRTIESVEVGGPDDPWSMGGCAACYDPNAPRW